MIDNITDQLRRDEGEVLHAYKDSLGYLTIGVGRLIDPARGGGITAEESAMLLNNDIGRTVKALTARFPFFSNLDAARQGVMINMAFQMGVDGLAQFTNTLACIEQGDYAGAAQRMIMSKWAIQTPQRAQRLADQMRDGNWR